MNETNITPKKRVLPHNPPNRCKKCGLFFTVPLHARGKRCECVRKVKRNVLKNINDIIGKRIVDVISHEYHDCNNVGFVTDTGEILILSTVFKWSEENLGIEDVKIKPIEKSDLTETGEELFLDGLVVMNPIKIPQL